MAYISIHLSNGIFVTNYSYSIQSKKNFDKKNLSI